MLRTSSCSALLAILFCSAAYSQALKPDDYQWRQRFPGAENTLGIIGSPHISVVYDKTATQEFTYVLHAEWDTEGGCAGRRWVIRRYDSVSNTWTVYHEFPLVVSDTNCSNLTSLLGGGSLAKFGSPGNIRLGVAYAVQLEGPNDNQWRTEIHYFQETSPGVFTQRILDASTTGAAGLAFQVRGTSYVGQYVSLEYQRPTNVSDTLPGIAIGLADYWNEDIVNLGLDHSMAYVYYVYSQNAANTAWDSVSVAAWKDYGECLQPPGGFLDEGFIDCHRYAGIGTVSLAMDRTAPLNERARIAYSRVSVPSGAVLPNTEGEIRYWDREVFENAFVSLEALVGLVESTAATASSFATGHAVADSGYSQFTGHQPVSLALDPDTNFPYIAYSVREVSGTHFNEIRAVMPTSHITWNPPEVVASTSHGPPVSSPLYIPFIADADQLWAGNLMIDDAFPTIDDGRVQLIMSAHEHEFASGKIALFRRVRKTVPGVGSNIVVWERDAVAGGGVTRPPSAALDPDTGRPVVAYYRENLAGTIDEVYWSDGGSLFINAGGLTPMVTGPPGVTIQMQSFFGIWTTNDLPPGNYTISATRTCDKGPNQTCSTVATVNYGLPTVVTCVPGPCDDDSCGTVPFAGESLSVSAQHAVLPLIPAAFALAGWLVMRRRREG